MRPQAAPTPPLGPLPCLQSNNSTKEGGVLSGNVWKSAFILAETVKAMASRHGIERLGFLTLTFKENVTSQVEAERRFNSIRLHVLKVRYPETIKVKERQTRGAWHFHLIVALGADVRTGFNFADVERQDYSSANPALRAEWAFWRETAPAYGFGRTELMPISSTAEGIGRYVGKYLQKHMTNRLKEDKGARLVSYSRGTRAGSTRFSWCGVKGWLWRAKYRQFAERLGFDDEESFKAWAYQEYGPKWAYKLAKAIAAELLSAWPTARHAEEDGIGLPEGMEDAVDIRIDRAEYQGGRRVKGTLKAETFRDRVAASPVRGVKVRPRVMFAPGGDRSEELPTVWTGRVGSSGGKAS